MTKIIAQTYTYTNGYRAYITYALIGMSILLASIYAMNVYAVVSRTVAIRHVSLQSASLSSAVQELDARYLGLSGKITPDAVRLHGMRQGEVSAYISRTPSLGRVAVRGSGL